MTRCYYVNPANTSDITGPYQEGEANVRLPDGRVVSRMTHIPSWDVYYANEDNSPTLKYYIAQPRAVSFVGTVKDTLARVQETNADTQLPIDDLYEEKQNEVSAYDAEVMFNSIPTSLNANWKLIVTARNRTMMEMMGVALAAGTPFPANADKHPLVGIYNPLNTKDPVRRFAVNSTQFQTLTREASEHDQALAAATEASQDSLNTKYNDGAGDWQQVADHDPADPAWNYPPYTPLEARHRAQA